MESKPEDIKDVDFFTRQILEGDGFAFMWVYKPLCPKCGGSRLRKLKKRDKVYVCGSCNNNFEKAEYDVLLKYNLEYTCPFCKHKDELHGGWQKPKNKNAQTVLKFVCGGCGKTLRVSRMKKKKAKKNK